jgi:hypothetical protein
MEDLENHMVLPFKDPIPTVLFRRLETGMKAVYRRVQRREAPRPSLTAAGTGR